MMYGTSGSTKTTQLYHLAKYIHKTTGKKIRMVHADPGGYAPFIDSGMIAQGIVEVFDFSSSVNALSDWRRLSEGYWPRTTTKGDIWFRSDAACKVGKEEWDTIGGYFIEGGVSVAETLRKHCSNQKGGLGLKESYEYEEDGYEFRGVTDFRIYDIVQGEVAERIGKGFSNMPCEWFVMTSLIGVGGVPLGRGKENVEPIYGPQITGNAVTHRVPSWFANCFHISQETYKDLKTDQEVTNKVAWFTEHRDSQSGNRYLCKSGMLPELIPELMKYFPYGFVPLGFKHGIDVYFAALEVLKKKMLGGEKMDG